MQGFLKSVLAKLNNERFVDNAPAKVVEAERKKQADAESKINRCKKVSLRCEENKNYL